MTVFGTRRWLYHFMHNDKVSSRGLAHFNLRRAQRYLNCQPDNNEHFIKTKSSDISSPVNAMKVDPPLPPKPAQYPPNQKTTPKAQTERKTAHKKGENKSLWQKVPQSFFICLGPFLSGSSRNSDCSIFKIM